MSKAKKTSSNPPKKTSNMTTTLKAEDHKREEVNLGGWPAGITTYRIDKTWYCKIDNVSPGATVARARGMTRDEALDAAIATATRRLASTRVHR